MEGTVGYVLESPMDGNGDVHVVGLVVSHLMLLSKDIGLTVCTILLVAPYLLALG
jgi:hypothetical protein